MGRSRSSEEVLQALVAALERAAASAVANPASPGSQASPTLTETLSVSPTPTEALASPPASPGAEPASPTRRGDGAASPVAELSLRASFACAAAVAADDAARLDAAPTDELDAELPDAAPESADPSPLSPMMSSDAAPLDGCDAASASPGTPLPEPLALTPVTSPADTDGASTPGSAPGSSAAASAVPKASVGAVPAAARKAGTPASDADSPLVVLRARRPVRGAALASDSDDDEISEAGAAGAAAAFADSAADLGAETDENAEPADVVAADVAAASWGHPVELGNALQSLALRASASPLKRASSAAAAAMEATPEAMGLDAAWCDDETAVEAAAEVAGVPAASPGPEVIDVDAADALLDSPKIGTLPRRARRPRRVVIDSSGSEPEEECNETIDAADTQPAVPDDVESEGESPIVIALPRRGAAARRAVRAIESDDDDDDASASETESSAAAAPVGRAASAVLSPSSSSAYASATESPEAVVAVARTSAVKAAQAVPPAGGADDSGSDADSGAVVLRRPAPRAAARRNAAQEAARRRAEALASDESDSGGDSASASFVPSGGDDSEASDASTSSPLRAKKPAVGAAGGRGFGGAKGIVLPPAAPASDSESPLPAPPVGVMRGGAGGARVAGGRGGSVFDLHTPSPGGSLPGLPSPRPSPAWVPANARTPATGARRPRAAAATPAAAAPADAPLAGPAFQRKKDELVETLFHECVALSLWRSVASNVKPKPKTSS